jgi:thioesterase-3
MQTPPIYEYALTIREGHLDTFGHVNNAVYLELFEEARWELITRGGYGMAKIRETGLGPTLLEAQLRFLKELRLRDEIVIKTQTVSYAGKIAVIRQWIENSEGARCCEAEFKIGLFDVRQRKLVLPTPEWLRAVGIR